MKTHPLTLPPLANPVPVPMYYVGKLADFLLELHRLQRLR